MFDFSDFGRQLVVVYVHIQHRFDVFFTRIIRLFHVQILRCFLPFLQMFSSQYNLFIHMLVVLRAEFYPQFDKQAVDDSISLVC
ncbi:Hypothetical protein YycT [Bacillus subtilis subsp. subtilis str. BSP1]|uniref:YycT protein n=1 Tax=Bacillus subtilis TaxID=1423 RepID=Q45602_BACIU|nr:Hypothetical protein YycT [Bacillus subtilis subsp. subtilis str. BSP1]BAA11282.1 yycT [Bacillus subtilis] [Bacillus subtilis subsp. subtilis str. 168]